MSLIVEIQNQVKDAMKSGDAKRRDALRLILNALKTEEKEKRVELTPEQEIEILTREAKKRREAIDAYTLAGSQEREKGFLMDTCLTAQDRFKAYLDYFRIAY